MAVRSTAAPSTLRKRHAAGRSGQAGGRQLRVVQRRGVLSGVVTDVSVRVGVSVFVGLLVLGILHGLEVQEQAQLDDLTAKNQQRLETIDQLVAEITYLDSPAGVAEQAAAVGLVPAAEVVTLSPVRTGVLAPPGPDPFRLGELADGAPDVAVAAGAGR